MTPDIRELLRKAEILIDTFENSKSTDEGYDEIKRKTEWGVYDLMYAIGFFDGYNRRKGANNGTMGR